MSGRDTSRSEAPLTGRCHCGNLELTLETSLRPEELSLRADTCSFCHDTNREDRPLLYSRRS